jgi:H+/Cl- antiporter ClcA
MVAFLTGITRSPFTSAILVLEMTDRHSVIFHLMLAAMISSIAALLIDKKSFYDHLKHQYIADIRKEDKPPEAVPAPGSDLTEIKKLASE